VATQQASFAYTCSANGFQVLFSGASNSAYRVWASTDLVNWLPLGTASEIAPGVFRYLDPAAASFPQRFYRAGTP
jgi:hypothetical protein